MSEEINNPFDLRKAAKKYNWGTENNKMQIVIDVIGTRNESDCYNQLYCWMRDHFKKITKMEIDLQFGDCTQEQINQVHDKFQQEFLNCVRYEAKQ